MNQFLGFFFLSPTKDSIFFSENTKRSLRLSVSHTRKKEEKKKREEGNKRGDVTMRTLGLRAGEVGCSSSVIPTSTMEKGKGGRRWEPGVSTEKCGEERKRCAAALVRGSNGRGGGGGGGVLRAAWWKKFQPRGWVGGEVGGCRIGSKNQRVCLGNWVCKSNNVPNGYA